MKKEVYWQEHIDKWQQGKVSQKEYCHRNNIVFSTFRYWRSRLLKRPQSQQRFFPLTITTAEKSESGVQLLIGDKDRFRITVQDDFSEDALKKVITVLEEMA